MNRLAVIAIAALSLVAGSALAQSMTDLYSDAGSEADAGNSRLEASDWQFRDGNVQEGCRIMEQARVHYETAENDMKAMDDMVHDPANGYSDDDQQKTMDWIHQQQATLNDIAGKMSDTYVAKCQ